MAKNNFFRELKSLGMEIGQAIKDMRSSQEFKHLEKEMVKGAKSVTFSLARALKAAKKSKSTAVLKKRIKRVVKAGKKEGMIQAERAQVLAATKIHEANKALKEVRKRIKQRNNANKED